MLEFRAETLALASDFALGHGMREITRIAGEGEGYFYIRAFVELIDKQNQ